MIFAAAAMMAAFVIDNTHSTRSEHLVPGE
jgi:hypothetical protein